MRAFRGISHREGTQDGKARKGQTHLPGSQAAATEQVPAWLDLHVLVALSTDLTEFERGVHCPVQLQLLLAGEKVGGQGRVVMSAMGYKSVHRKKVPNF